MLWIIETLEHESFPCRLMIRRGDDTALRLRLRIRWPGAGSQIFCLREDEPWETDGIEVEQAPIVFAGNRKLGREWTIRYFRAIQSHREDRTAAGVAAAAAAYKPETPFAGERAFEIRKRTSRPPFRTSRRRR